MTEQQCFVIQPFDGGPFDKRFDEVVEPAIRDAGMKAYRVDRDPSAHVPIENIEENIRASAACVADISMDRPNVWYEVGYAFACDHPVVLICSRRARENGRFPFDIQHRNITSYESESVSDFETLRREITKRLTVIRGQREGLTRLSNANLASTGLSSQEATALATVLANCPVSTERVSPHEVMREMFKVGFSGVAASHGIRSLVRKGLVEESPYQDHNGDEYCLLGITNKGIDWFERNQDQFVMKTPDSSQAATSDYDDLPF